MLQVSAIACGVFTCFVLLSAAWPSLSRHGKEVLWTFYQPLVPPLLMLWLWGHLVWTCETQRIHYTSCFAHHHQRYCATHSEILRVRPAPTTLVTAAHQQRAGQGQRP
jgi:hypothetical protein